VDHRRLLDRGDRLDRLSPNAIWLVSRVISVDTEIAEELRAKVVEIVNTRPVHRTLESSAVVVTSVGTRSEAEPRAVPGQWPGWEDSVKCTIRRIGLR
jgi:hypothetical protein